jgi:hypothetical protein
MTNLGYETIALRPFPHLYPNTGYNPLAAPRVNQGCSPRRFDGQACSYENSIRSVAGMACSGKDDAKSQLLNHHSKPGLLPELTTAPVLPEMRSCSKDGREHTRTARIIYIAYCTRQ